MVQQLSPSQVALFRYIEDADLWRWHLKDSKQFHAGNGIEVHAAETAVMQFVTAWKTVWQYALNQQIVLRNMG